MLCKDVMFIVCQFLEIFEVNKFMRSFKVAYISIHKSDLPWINLMKSHKINVPNGIICEKNNNSPYGKVKYYHKIFHKQNQHPSIERRKITSASKICSYDQKDRIIF